MGSSLRSQASLDGSAIIFSFGIRAPLPTSFDYYHSGSAIERVASLPSDNWHELKDLWVCACTSEMMRNNAALSSLDNGDIRARAGMVLVGFNHLLVHKSNLQTRSLCESATSALFEGNKKWIPVLCRRCFTELGRLESVTNAPRSEGALEKNCHSFRCYSI